jgi:rubrerythrin
VRDAGAAREPACQAGLRAARRWRGHCAASSGRMERLDMVTTRGTETDLFEAVANMIELDLDAAEAYKAAIARLQDPGCKLTLGTFLADHERHVRDLTAFLHRASRVAPTKADFKRFLTQGKVYIGQIVGDRGILMAMRSNEADTNQAYEQACERKDLIEEVREILFRGLADERRHRDWIDQRLASMAE